MRSSKLFISIAIAATLCVICSLQTKAQGEFSGKRMVVIGDSYVRNHRRPVEETWHYRVAARLGMDYRNYGRNGNCIAFDRTQERFGPSILQRYHEMTDSADVVLVIAGHNDAYKVVSIEKGEDIFRQKLDSLCTGLRAKYPQAGIGFVTPWNVDEEGFATVISAIREVCDRHGIPVLDAAHTSGIRPGDADFRRRYFQSPNDKAHLNAEGHGLLLDWGEEFVRQLIKNN